MHGVAEDVEHLLGHPGVPVDRGSVHIEERAVGEVEIPFCAMRSDGRDLRSVLRLLTRIEDDCSSATVYAEVLARV